MILLKSNSLGIGRPSTYATIIQTIKDRDYVILKDKKFEPTDIGYETTDKLQEFFANIVNVKYTAQMEKDLDDIAEAKKDNIKVLKDFYADFAPLVEKAFHEMEKKAPETTGEKCPECGGDLVYRQSKYGTFVACGNYPKCKYVQKSEKQVVEICDCPKCGGKIIERQSKKGKVFYGCANFPKCKYALWDKPTGEKCPKCGELLVEKNKKIICSNCDE